MNRVHINLNFGGKTLEAETSNIISEMQELYKEDNVPWVIGYSGGKDSTAVLQLVWLALKKLPADERHKPVHVISTDTLVENPVVAAWVSSSLEAMTQAAEDQGLPIQAHRLTPRIKDTFWVNLIGRGYPAPRPKFRWCTDRLKIQPSNTFIKERIKEYGETILVLGTRKAESSARASTMTKLEKGRTRDKLSPNASLPGSLVFSPIENWTNDDVWIFLMQIPNQWGYPNKDLLTMYQGASADGECPLVVDTTTPSCGSSRFGCWTCTLVEKDKSMTAMIQNDEEKEWMLPLLELRDDLDVSDDRHLRDFRRMNGNVTAFHDSTIPGPYTQKAREDWLKKLLLAQQWVRENGPQSTKNIELITIPELQEIRRIWVFEKHEIEDTLPRIYEGILKEELPGKDFIDTLELSREDVDLLKEVCGGDTLHFEMARSLIAVEKSHRTMSRRAGLFDQLEKELRRGFYEDETDATKRAQDIRELKALKKS